MGDYQTISIVLTGIGMIIAMTYYALQIRNQNKTRQAQLVMQIYNTYNEKEYDARAHTVSSLEYSDYDEFIEKYGRENNPEVWKEITSHVTYLEGIGVLNREGYVDIRLVAMLISGDIIRAWNAIQPWVYESRKRLNWPRFAIETEFLYDTLMEYAEKHPELQI